MNRSLHVTAAMRDTKLSDKQIQELTVWIGPFLKATKITLTPSADFVLDVQPDFKEALTILGVFKDD